MTGTAGQHPGPLRVGINLCWLVPGVVGGSEDLLIGWLRALADHPACDPATPDATRLELTIFGPASLGDAHPDLRHVGCFVAAPVQGRAKPLRVATEATWLALQQRRRRLEVMHHAGGVVPLLHPGKSVLTVHDIQPLDLPENFSAIKRRYLAGMLPRSVRAADIIVATSAFVVDRLVERLGADRDRCRVVLPALRAAPAAATESAELRVRYRLGKHYVLYPAVAYAHKNHRVLYEALRQLRDEQSEADVQLVCTGGAGPLDTELADFVDRHRLHHAIRHLGRVPQTDYEALVAAADALVFPSRYEGFGLGAFDALAAGRPVLVSDAPALIEVVGRHGARIACDDAAAWAQQIALVCSSPQRRAELAAASAARAGCFDAHRSAAGLLAAYRAARMPVKELRP